MKLKGGKLSVNNIKLFLQASYMKQPDQNINGYILDPSLSNDYVKTYYNPSQNHAVVIHRGTEGTLSDWSNNLIYGIGGKNAYKNTQRYKISKQIEDEAIKKYGIHNVSTLGHSQGALLSELVAPPNSKEIITYNKASNPFGISTTHKNQYDIRTTYDPVSGAQYLNPLNWFKSPFRKHNQITIQSKATGVAAHDINELNKLDPNQMIGQAIKKGGNFSSILINLLINYVKSQIRNTAYEIANNFLIDNYNIDLNHYNKQVRDKFIQQIEKIKNKLLNNKSININEIRIPNQIINNEDYVEIHQPKDEEEYEFIGGTSHNTNYKVQSILINKNMDEKQAINFILKHYKLKKIDETKHYYRFRQYNPSYLKKLGYTIIKTKKINNDVELIIYYKPKNEISYNYI
jgi:hypothetical protein